MNIDEKTIESRIREYQLELAVLRQAHDQMVATFQQQQTQFNERVGQNQNRFQQLTGAIGELEQLKQTFQVKETDNENEPMLSSGVGGIGEPPIYRDPVHRPDRRPGGDRRFDLGHRTMDKPDPAAG
jgi:TolA-binding protein